MPRIIIPTRNRPAALNSMMAYLDTFYPDTRVIVADGSSEEHGAVNARNMRQPGLRIEIDYRKYPYSMQLFDRLLDVVENESDDYFIMGSDDDYPLMDNLALVHEAMCKNPDVVTGLGATIHFTLEPENELFVRLGLARPIRGPDPVARARNFSQWMFSTTYAVTRRELLIERFIRSKEVFLPGFFDFGVGIHDVLHGKLIAIPSFTFFATRNFNHSYLRIEDPLHFIRHPEEFLRFEETMKGDLRHYANLSEENATQIATGLLQRNIGKVVGFPAQRLRDFESMPHFQNPVVQTQLTNFDDIFKEEGQVREQYIERMRYIVDQLKMISESTDNVGEMITVSSLDKQTTEEVMATELQKAEETRMFRRKPAAAKNITKPSPMVIPGQVRIDVDSLLHSRNEPDPDVHLLVLGQSNVANHGQTLITPSFGSMTGANGELLPLADPVHGGTGKNGSVWTRFAELLSKQRFKGSLTITLRAAGGTGIEDWASGGAQYDSLNAEIGALAKLTPPITHIVWHQGERDTLLNTDRSRYLEKFATLHALVAAHLPNAIWLVCQASYRFGKTNDKVIAAQNHIIANMANCHRGPNTDVLRAELRHDDAHLNDKGQSEFARMLALALQDTL